jgi:o-succinylbenzoate synthase
MIHHTLRFGEPRGTSRGVYTTRGVWYVTVFDGGRWGVGECAPLPSLSCDDLPEYASILASVCRGVEEAGCIDVEAVRRYPSILFGLETAFGHLSAGSFRLWDTPFSRGEQGIPVNGLVWMGGYDDMLRRVGEKIEGGFRCIKLKVGAIDFDSELALLRRIRRQFTASELELRLDANGAFSPAEALEKLRRLSDFDIHSVEQPVRAGQWDEMARLADLSPIPVALDEELIGCNSVDDKRRLIGCIRPQYIVLKPSLHGGYAGCTEWIAEAQGSGAGWWVTSALESNVGLNAIAQWCATLRTSMPQGLGTGSLFTNNVRMPLQMQASTDTPPALWWKEARPSIWEGGRVGEALTSGSTGEPRTFVIRLEHAAASARATCSALGLKRGDRALLCMPLEYIGAKMMIARSIVAGLELIVRAPSGRPLEDPADVGGGFRFAAMLPMQVFNSLQTPAERERLMAIGILIIGGAALDKTLEEELRSFPNAVYSTYGMTETLSHIALRRLNGREASAYYSPLEGVRVCLSGDGRLCIDAPAVTDGRLLTNDMACVLPDGRFRITGRWDNVINTGGVKVQAEALEDRLRASMPAAFAVTSMPDARLGEAVVLLVERGDYTAESLREIVRSLPCAYERPRRIRQVTAIPLTGNGKINRAACKELALTHEDI